MGFHSPRVPVPRRPEAVASLAAAMFSVGIGFALSRDAVALTVLLTGGSAAIVILGPEFVALLGWLAAMGIMPFVDPNLKVGGLPLWAVAATASGALVIALWAVRRLRTERATATSLNVVAYLAIALLAYSTIRLAGSHPMDIPSLAAPFVAVPALVLVVLAWLGDTEAYPALRRAVIVIGVLSAAWSVAYILGSAEGCSPCLNWVNSTSARPGLLGPASRIYAPGTLAILLVSIVSFAAALRTPGVLTVGLAALTLAPVILAGSRAQYFALAVGLLLVVAWRLRRAGLGGRVAIVVVSTVLALIVGTSAVGERAFSGYRELQGGYGNSAYRLTLIDQQSRYWSPFGAGISFATLNQGYDVDLGIPNTILVIGFAGAALQIALLLAGTARSLLAGTAFSVGIAGFLLTTVASRPSLPSLEVGPSAIVVGLVLGVAAWLTASRLAVLGLGEGEDQRPPHPDAGGQHGEAGDLPANRPRS